MDDGDLERDLRDFGEGERDGWCLFRDGELESRLFEDGEGVLDPFRGFSGDFECFRVFSGDLERFRGDRLLLWNFSAGEEEDTLYLARVVGEGERDFVFFSVEEGLELEAEGDGLLFGSTASWDAQSKKS